MNLDMNSVLADMLLAIKGIVGGNWEKVKTTANQFLEHDKERLQQIAELRISGDLTEDKFISRLEDEKLIIEAEINALTVVSKAIAQNAVNAAMDVLLKAVAVVVKGAI